MDTKKLRLKTLVYVAATVLFFCVSSGVNAERESRQAQKITWKVENKGFIKKRSLSSYRYVPTKRLSKDQAFEIIGRLQKTSGIKMQFGKVHQNESRLIINSEEDPSAVFDIDTSTGTFLFNAGLKKYSGEGNTPGLPSKRQAPELALEYLAKLKYMPMNQEELVMKNVSGLGMSLAKNGKASEKYHKLVSVLYRRILDGVPVQGRGSRIVVHIGANASLAGLINNWPVVKAEKVRLDRVRSDKSILEEINSRLVKMAGQAREITVREAKLVLFDDGLSVIEPAIYVVADARYDGPKRTAEKTNIPVDFYVPVLMEFAGYYPFQQDAEAKRPSMNDRPGKAVKFRKDENE